MNIIYIRAAIEANTGIHLSLEDVRQYLLEENIVDKRRAKNLIFPGYRIFYKETDKKKLEMEDIPVDKVLSN